MKYPVFKKRKNSEVTVCFSGKHIGHVVVGNRRWKIGEYYEGWESIEDTEIWEDWEPPKKKVKLYKWAYKFKNYWEESTCFYETEEDSLKNVGGNPTGIKRLNYTMIEVEEEE